MVVCSLDNGGSNRCPRSVVGVVVGVWRIQQLRDGKGFDVWRHGEGVLLDVGAYTYHVEAFPVVRDTVLVRAGCFRGDVVEMAEGEVWRLL